MTSIACHEATTDDRGNPIWQLVTAPECITARFGQLVLELPDDCRATCNGIPVVDIQVLQSGEMVRLRRNGEADRCLHIGRMLPVRESGDCRPDSFTGLPIPADAVRCPCGELYDALRTAPLMKKCVGCERSLCNDIESPPEELL